MTSTDYSWRISTCCVCRHRRPCWVISLSLSARRCVPTTNTCGVDCTFTLDCCPCVDPILPCQLVLTHTHSSDLSAARLQMAKLDGLRGLYLCGNKPHTHTTEIQMYASLQDFTLDLLTNFPLTLLRDGKKEFAAPDTSVLTFWVTQFKWSPNSHYQSTWVTALPGCHLTLHPFLSYLFSSSCKHLSVFVPPLPQWWWRVPGWLCGCLPFVDSSCPASTRLRRVLVLYYLASPSLLLFMRPAANSPSPGPSHLAPVVAQRMLVDGVLEVGRGRVTPAILLLQQVLTANSSGWTLLLCVPGGGRTNTWARNRENDEKEVKERWRGCAWKRDRAAQGAMFTQSPMAGAE